MQLEFIFAEPMRVLTHTMDYQEGSLLECPDVWLAREVLGDTYDQ